MVTSEKQEEYLPIKDHPETKAVHKLLKDTVPDHKYRMWIEPLEARRENGLLSIGTPNDFFAKRLKDEYALPFNQAFGVGGYEFVPKKKVSEKPKEGEKNYVPDAPDLKYRTGDPVNSGKQGGGKTLEKLTVSIPKLQSQNNKTPALYKNLDAQYDEKTFIDHSGAWEATDMMKEMFEDLKKGVVPSSLILLGGPNFGRSTALAYFYHLAKTEGYSVGHFDVGGFDASNSIIMQKPKQNRGAIDVSYMLGPDVIGIDGLQEVPVVEKAVWNRLQVYRHLKGNASLRVLTFQGSEDDYNAFVEKLPKGEFQSMLQRGIPAELGTPKKREYPSIVKSFLSRYECVAKTEGCGGLVDFFSDRMSRDLPIGIIGNAIDRVVKRYDAQHNQGRVDGTMTVDNAISRWGRTMNMFLQGAQTSNFDKICTRTLQDHNISIKKLQNTRGDPVIRARQDMVEALTKEGFSAKEISEGIGVAVGKIRWDKREIAKRY